MELNNMILLSAACVQAIATVTIVAVAIFTYLLNKRLAADNRRLIHSELEPKVVAYLSQELREQQRLVCLVVENIGKGPARDVKALVQVIADENEYANYEFQRILKDINAENLEVSYLPQGVRAHISILSHDAQIFKRPVPVFAVKVSYESLSGCNFEREFEIDVSRVSRAWITSRA